jgi:hypothetical protein
MSMMLLVIDTSGTRSESGRGTDPCVFPHNCRELNDLMDTKSAVASTQTAESAPRDSDTTSDADP